MPLDVGALGVLGWFLLGGAVAMWCLWILFSRWDNDSW